MSGLILLEDYDLDNKYEICEELVKGEPKLFYRGVLARANYPNKNKRIYPMSIMEAAVDRIQNTVKQRGFVGELEHPPTPKVNVDRISHVITEVRITSDGSVLGQMEPIDTDAGRNLKAMMKARIKLGVSTRGTGTVRPYSGSLGEGLVEVNPDFNLIAVDVVYSPSNDAWPDIVSESHTVMLGQSTAFRNVWNNVFGKF